MGSARATTNSRLSVDDWIQAGFAILAEEGIKALKIDRLCRRLSVTKGSFYWHFTDIAGYRAALVQAWGELRDDDRGHFGELAELPPRERLSEMMSSLVSARHWTLERAMREWARTDDAAAASAHFLDNPLQRIKRDVDVICGHVVFDYDTSRELAAALTLGMKVPRTAMV